MVIVPNSQITNYELILGAILRELKSFGPLDFSNLTVVFDQTSHLDLGNTSMRKYDRKYMFQQKVKLVSGVMKY